MASHLKGATAAATHSAVLDLIRSSGVVSRTELVSRTGLTGASITRIVKQMLTEGLIVETGVGERTGGKRRTLIQLNPTARYAVGISLDVATITYVIADLSGSVVARQDLPGFGRDDPSAVMNRIAIEAVGLINDSMIDPSALMGIGMAVAGRQDSAHHALRSDPTSTDWEFFDMEQTLAGATGLPVLLENDSTCAAIGEFWIGRVPAAEDFATVYMAGGIGLGLVTGGDVYRGSSSNVGEIGHLILDVNGPPCWCGSRGCLEVLAAPRRVVRRALDQPGLAAELGLATVTESLDEDAQLRKDIERVTAAAAAGHPAALALVEESAFYLGKALVSTTNLLDLDRIVLAGPGFGAAAEVYLRVVSADLERLSFVRAVHPTQVSLSRSGELSAALGAASVVLHNRLTPHQVSARAEGTGE